MSIHLRMVCLIAVAAFVVMIASTAARAQPNHGAGAAASMTPLAAYNLLAQGFRRYVACANGCAGPCFRCSRDSTRAGQRPYAGVLTCMDSRTTPDYIFSAPPGQLFVWRDAGNVVDTVIVGGMEYAVVVKHVPLLVVMGHTGCGAVEGSCDSNAAYPPSLAAVLKMIRPAIWEARRHGITGTCTSQAFLDSVASYNVRLSIERIKQLSPQIAQRVAQRSVAIVGCLFNVGSGVVTWVTPPPQP